MKTDFNFLLEMNPILRLLKYFFLWVCCAQHAYPQTEQEVWKCGNLLTNQPELDGNASEKTKCKLLETPRSSVTVMGGNQQLTTTVSKTGPNSLVPYSVSEQNSRDQMAKIILLNERTRLTARQTLLEGRIKGLTLAPSERQDIESEMSRNTADLNGLAREIAKLQ